MKCLSLFLAPISCALENLGLYEPEITESEAYKRLSQEAKIWNKFKGSRGVDWDIYQSDNRMQGDLPGLVSGALSHLDRQGITRGTAVDLGCGISRTTLYLLESGWKVYAVDSSHSVMSMLRDRVHQMSKKWIESGNLVLVTLPIEKFEYPEKVDLITAMDALPYCDPEEIGNIFMKAKNALNTPGLFVCTLMTYSDNSLALTDSIQRQAYGGWMTTKNVIEAVMDSVDFSSCTVTKGYNRTRKVKQFHITAAQFKS